MAMIWNLNASLGAVAIGRKRAVLYEPEAANSAASGGYGVRAMKRTCLVVSWDSGVHAGGRQGLEVVGLRGNDACSMVRVGMVDNGMGAAFLAVLVIVSELGLVERGR